MPYSTVMVPRIRAGNRGRIFLAEWMEERGVDDKRLAERLDVERPTVTRWRNYPGRLSLPAIQGIADALGMEGPADLFRHPKRPSIDAMLANDPDELHARARAMIGILKSTGT